MPIGHFLGNDFDRLILGTRYRKRTIRCEIAYEHRRRGQGRITDVFTTPWRDIAHGQSYSEPFPTGIVENGDNYRLTARWHPLHWFYGDLLLSYWQWENRDNMAAVL